MSESCGRGIPKNGSYCWSIGGSTGRGHFFQFSVKSGIQKGKELHLGAGPPI